VRVGNDEHAAAVPRRAGRAHPLHAGDEERHEDHVEPLAGEHQRPERQLLLARLHHGGEGEVSGHHGRSRGLGQGSRASMAPATSTNKISPMKKDMALKA
jgi:hypothetical protein